MLNILEGRIRSIGTGKMKEKKSCLYILAWRIWLRQPFFIICISTNFHHFKIQWIQLLLTHVAMCVPIYECVYNLNCTLMIYLFVVIEFQIVKNHWKMCQQMCMNQYVDRKYPIFWAINEQHQIHKIIQTANHFHP